MGKNKTFTELNNSIRVVSKEMMRTLLGGNQKDEDTEKKKWSNSSSCGASRPQ